MKVLFTFGGLPHYLTPILNRLNDVENIEVVVAIPKSGAATLGDNVKTNNDNVKFKVIGLEEKKAFYGNYYLKGLLDVLKVEKPDVLITIWPYVLNIVYGFSLKRYLKKNGIKLMIKEIPFDIPECKNTYKYYSSKYALELNEDLIQKTKVNIPFYIKHFILKTVRKYYYGKLLDASICYNENGKEICSSYGLKRDAVFVSTNSPDTDEMFKALDAIKEMEPILPENPYRLIHIGRLVKWKRVDLIIEAVDQLKASFPQIELIIVGKGKEEENLKNMVASRELSKHVQFIGGVYDNNELGRYLLFSSIYVLAGMGGLSINQAMAFGKPVVCSIADGTEKKLVKDGVNGFFFENGNAEDLGEKIKLLLNDIDKIQLFGKNSISIIKNEVNVYTVINEYVKAFNYLTKNKYKLKEISPK